MTPKQATRYRFAWGNNSKRATMKGRECRIVAAGAMNSVMIEFADNGQREVVSRRALRKAHPTPEAVRCRARRERKTL